MPDADAPLRTDKEIRDPFALSPLDEAVQRGNGMSLDAKVNLMDLRMRSLRTFEDISLGEFISSLPGLERLLTLLAQSTIDICCGLLLDKTGSLPRSYCDVLASCEKKHLLPTGLVRRLAVRLFLINNCFENADSVDLRELHEDMGETARSFRQFLEHVKGSIESAPGA